MKFLALIFAIIGIGSFACAQIFPESNVFLDACGLIFIVAAIIIALLSGKKGSCCS